MSYVYDSSAMLAFLRDESGADVVEAQPASGAPCFAHAVNLCEVFYDVLRGGGDAARAESRIAVLKGAGIEERADLDAAFWRDMAVLIASHRGPRKRLALGDCFGVALARRLDADFVTADRGEPEAVRAAGACSIIFIR